MIDILVVDDDNDIREFLRDNLEITMPLLDGFEVLGKIRHKEFLKGFFGSLLRNIRNKNK